MRLLKLRLENWSCHGLLEVDLQSGLQIEGRNGTGKSSILEALRFIFKKTATGYTSRIRNGERHCLVQLTFSKEGKEYAVEKHLYADKPSTASLICESVQIADNPTSVYNALQKTLPEDVLEKLIYVPQNQITSVLDKLSGKEGKVELDRLFGLDKLEKVWEGIGAEVTQAEAKKELLASQLKKYPEDAQTEYERVLLELRKKTEDMKRSIEESRIQEANASRNLKASEEKLKVMTENRRLIEISKSELSKLQVRREGILKELENAKRKVEELEDKRKQLEKLQAEQKSLEKFRLVKKLLSENKAHQDKLIALGDLEVEKERKAAIEKELSGKRLYEENLSVAEKAYREAEKRFSEETAELRSLMEYFLELNSLRKNARCPKCGQIMSEFHLSAVREETSERIKVLEKQIIESEGAYNQNGKKVDEARLALATFRDLEVELRHLSETFERHERSERAFKEIIAGSGRKLADAGYAGEELSVVENKADELSRVEARIGDIEPEVGKISGMMAGERTLSEELREVTSRAGELEKRLNALVYDEKSYEEEKQEHDRTMEQKYALCAKINTGEKELEVSVKEREDTESKRGEYLDFKNKHDETSREVALLKSARDVFHRDKGLAKYLREKFVGQLNSRITFYFKIFNQKPQYNEVCFDREYNIQFKTTGGVLDVEQMSGGERTQLALALRIALIDIMSPIRLLILDEPFGSLDEEHREVLGETLNSIAASGQLILVTHVHVDSLRLPNRLDLGGY